MLECIFCQTSFRPKYKSQRFCSSRCSVRHRAKQGTLKPRVKLPVDEVLIAYTDYQSSLNQNPVIRSLFPFQPEASVTAGVQKIGEEITEEKLSPKVLGYIHEPSKRDVLSFLVPRLGELQLFQALLESNASEHSSRMVAMKNATDAAGEMLDDLTLQFNRARQAAITQEIAEISAGMAAVT